MMKVKTKAVKSTTKQWQSIKIMTILHASTHVYSTYLHIKTMLGMELRATLVLDIKKRITRQPLALINTHIPPSYRLWQSM